MEMTFTNPFEVITDNVIFGLDTIKNPGNTRIRRQAEETDQELATVKIPKYNNYMKKVI